MESVTFFNLLINSTLSLATGLLVVSFSIWLFRVETGPWKLFLLSLPFLKIVYDVLRGVPANSVVFGGVDPFSLPPNHQMFSIGAGLTPWGPVLTGLFTVADLKGNHFAASVGDYFYLWFLRQFGENAPTILVSCILIIATFLFCRRFIQAVRFEVERRQDRHDGRLFRQEKLGWRAVDIYISKKFEGTPFTGGLFRPYICLPEKALQALEENEVEAVIAHELGHVNSFDLVGTVLIQFLGDLFWFVPGYRWLSRKIDRLRELIADQSALARGTNPLVLASAMVKLKEASLPAENYILYSAFFRERSLLRLRVQRLLGTQAEKKARLGWSWFWIRILVSIWIVSAVLVATIGGYRSESPMVIFGWVRQAIEVFYS